MKHGYKEFAIIGAGRFGSSMAETLYDLGCEVLIIDKDEELVEMVSSHVTHAIRADVTENGVLEQLGLHNFDVVVVAIGQDMQASVLITMMLKELGVPYIIAKSQSDIHGRILQRIGADKVVYPERDMGQLFRLGSGLPARLHGDAPQKAAGRRRRAAVYPDAYRYRIPHAQAG